MLSLALALLAPWLPQAAAPRPPRGVPPAPAPLSGVLLDLREGEPGDGYGYGAVALGDWNGDGYEDFAVSAPAIDCGRSGAVRVHSGADGALLRTFAGASPGEEFGAALCALDWNRDGVLDLVVGAPLGIVEGEPAGYAEVFCGRRGTSLARLHGQSSHGRFGAALAAFGDGNGDGWPDLAVGAPGEGEHGGVVHGLSGGSGHLLWRAQGGAPNRRLGAALAPIGDLDGDGRDDVIAGAPGYSLRGPESGAVQVLCGRTGRVRRSFYGRRHGELYGSAVAPLGDWDGDGVGDLAVGAPSASRDDLPDVGRVEFLSGKFSSPLGELVGSEAGERTGERLLGSIERRLLVVGAPFRGGREVDAKSRRGAVLVVTTNGVESPLEHSPALPGSRFGSALAFLSRPNGPALLVGAPHRDRTFPSPEELQPGRALVLALELPKQSPPPAAPKSAGG